jgi:WD40 repeat protein/tRNA A-37 threonylcarbamoyl transferase component Bud32
MAWNAALGSSDRGPPFAPVAPPTEPGGVLSARGMEVMKPATDVPLTGRTLGDFTVGEKLGEGGQGVVYRAEQRVLRRAAVIKILHARHGTDEAVVSRFLREAQLASRLDHPFAAHIYAFGAEPDGLLWIAMELVRGTTLRAVVASQPGGRLPVVRAIPLLESLCEVVHTAHEQGIVHRDLKPDNVMVLARAGRLLPKLLDLGIAKLVHAAGPARVDAASARAALALADTAAGASHTGLVLGSPRYMAPEQWQDPRAIDARSDQYALGVVAFELIAGRPPYAGATLADLAEAHLHGAIPALPGDVPAGLSDVVARALAKRPADRYPSVLGFAAALRVAAGLRLAADALPQLDDDLRAELAWQPQPIADAAAALEAARNPHQARDALWSLVGVIVRWLGVVALCARSRTGAPGGEPAAVADQIRALHRGDLDLAGWLGLVRDLVRPFAAIRDAHAVPELVDLALAEPSPFAAVLALRAGEAAPASEDALRDQLATALAALAPALRAIGFLASYPLVVPRGDRAELWMGTRRAAHAAITVAGELPLGEPALVDLDGRPVLQLAPLVQVAAPTPDARDELFVFAGPGRVREHGARLVAEPHGLERHDDEVWRWLRAGLLAADDPAAQPAERTPYRGLAAFTEADADAFFGREREITAFVNQLREQTLLVVIGPSGAGKSSFVRAGVIPALPAGWRADVLRPGPTPLAALARITGEPDVLVVDQLEELFTLCGERAERERFAAELVRRTRAGEPTRVVLVVRDDFLARTGELAALRDRLARAVTLLATPGDGDLTRALVEPARRAGYQLEAGLAERIVGAVAGRPGALAVLSFAALRLWELRDRHFHQLTAAAYEAIGGVEGALARHAEATLHACRADEQRLVREAFRHLITAEGTRAHVARGELEQVLGGGAAARAVIERLIDARLIVAADGEAGAQHVELIHEALIGAWPRLVQWRRADAEGARLRDQLHEAARQWHDRGAPRGLLWRDEALDDYTRWRARWPGVLPALDQAFADASVRAAARGRRVRRGLAAAATAALVVVALLLGVLYRSSRHSAAIANTALIDSLVQQGQRELFGGDYAAALPLFAQAYRAGDRSVGLRALLHRALRLADQPRAKLHGQATDARFRPGGRTVLALGFDGDAAVIEAATGHLTAQLPAAPGPRTHSVAGAISGDGRRVAVARGDAIALWDGDATATLGAGRVLDPATTRIALDATGAELAVASAGTLELWRVADGHRQASYPIGDAGLVHWVGDHLVAQTGRGVLVATPAAARVVGPAGEIAALDEARFAAIEPRRVTVRDPAGEVQQTFELPDVTVAAVSPDGQRIALGVRSGVVEIDDLSTGRRVGVLAGHTARVVAAAFTPDGARLVTVSGDHSVRIWDLARARELVRYVGFDSSALHLGISADGAHVAVTCADDIRIYPIEDPAALRVIDVREPVGAAQLVAGGRQILATATTAVELWDAGSGARLAHLSGHPFDGAHLSPDGRLVAIPIADANVVELRALPDGALRARLVSDAQPTWATFDPTGQLVATGNLAGAIEVWELDGRRRATLRGHPTVIQDVAFSPDGARLVSASNDRTARIWDVASGRELARVQHDDAIDAARFDRGGARFLTAGEDRNVSLWDSATGAPIRTFRAAAAVRSVASRDGLLIAGATASGDVQLWEVATGREVGRFRHARGAMAVDFAGDRLLSTSLDGRIAIWDVATEPADDDLVARVCRVLRDQLGRVDPTLACDR